MARLHPSKLIALNRVLTQDAMQPTLAAGTAGVSYATAKRYYDLWSDEIKRSLEAKLLPSLEASVKRTARKKRLRGVH